MSALRNIDASRSDTFLSAIERVGLSEDLKDAILRDKVESARLHLTSCVVEVLRSRTLSSQADTCRMDEQPGSDKDDGITICFDKNVYMPVPLRTLEAFPPSLKAMLYECQPECSVKLSVDSLDSWELMLHHMDPDCMSEDVSDEIECVSAETITELMRMCKAYEITTLSEMIDETTAVGIEVSAPCSRHQPRMSELDYINVDLEERYFEIVRQNFEMLESEEALARFLVQVIKTNEKRLEARIARRMTTNGEGWKSAMESIHKFVKEMHDAERYRFCSFFAEMSMRQKVNSSVFSIHD